MEERGLCHRTVIGPKELVKLHDRVLADRPGAEKLVEHVGEKWDPLVVVLPLRVATQLPRVPPVLPADNPEPLASHPLVPPPQLLELCGPS